MNKKGILILILAILSTSGVGFAQAPTWVNDGLGADEDWTNKTTELSANWEEVAGHYGYEYAIGTTPGGTEVLKWTIGGKQRYVTQPGLSLRHGAKYYFAVRTRLSPYESTPAYSKPTISNGITVDTVPPTSRVNPLPSISRLLSFTVTWGGGDDLSGIRHYDVQFRVGENGTWTNWLTSTTKTSSTFHGVNGRTYYFRCRAQDNAGNWEPYPATPDTYTKPSITMVTLRVTPSPNGLIFYKGDKRATVSYTISVNGPVGVRLTEERVVYQFENGTRQEEVSIISERVLPGRPLSLRRVVVLDDTKRLKALSGKARGRFSISRIFTGYDDLGNPVTGSSPVMAEVLTIPQERMFGVRGARVILPRTVPKGREFRPGIRLRTSPDRIGEVIGNIYINGRGWQRFRIPQAEDGDIIFTPPIPGWADTLDIEILYPDRRRIRIPLPWERWIPPTAPEEEEVPAPEEPPAPEEKEVLVPEEEEAPLPEGEPEEPEDEWLCPACGQGLEVCTCYSVCPACGQGLEVCTCYGNDWGMEEWDWEDYEWELESWEESAAVEEITWEDFEPEGPNGGISVGHQTVENELGETKQAVTTNAVLNLTRPLTKETELTGSVKAKNQELTTGKEEEASLSIGLRGPLGDIELSGDVSNSLDTIDKVNHRSRVDNINLGFGLSVFEKFPLKANYSKSFNKNTEKDLALEEREEVVQKELTSEELKFSLGTRFGQVETDLTLNLGETFDPVEVYRTISRTAGLSSKIPFARIFQLNLGYQPTETETIPEDKDSRVSSNQVDYTAGLITKPHERLKLTTNFGWNNGLDESQEQKARREGFTQKYEISYKPLDPLTLETTYDLSDSLSKTTNVEGLSETETDSVNRSRTYKTKADINYRPTQENPLSQTGLGFQSTRIEDDKGYPKSEDTKYNLNLQLNPIKDMSLSCDFTDSSMRTYPITEEMGNEVLTLNHILNLGLSHTIFEGLSYGLDYGLNEKETQREEDVEENPKSITRSYSGNIEYSPKIGWREFPITVSQVYTRSQDSEQGQEVDTETTNASIKIPIIGPLSTSYAYSINKARTETNGAQEEANSEETTSQTVGLGISAGPFALNTEYTLTESRDDEFKNSEIQSLNASVAYSILRVLSLNINFIHNRTITFAKETDAEDKETTTSNLTAGLTYTF